MQVDSGGAFVSLAPFVSLGVVVASKQQQFVYASLLGSTQLLFYLFLACGALIGHVLLLYHTPEYNTVYPYKIPGIPWYYGIRKSLQ